MKKLLVIGFFLVSVFQAGKAADSEPKFTMKRDFLLGLVLTVLDSGKRHIQ